MPFRSTKTYVHSVGLSACFRQWRAQSHCRFLHGYALSFKFVFEAKFLDENNWVVDFGSLKPLRKMLEDAFDHKLVIAKDDPEGVFMRLLAGRGIADVRFVDAVGCEAFAQYAYHLASELLRVQGIDDRVRVVSCECREHDANSAIYVGVES